MSKKSAGFASIVPVTLLAALPGCLTPAPAPPPEAVLAGDWSLTSAENPDLTRMILTFDANGVPTRVEYKIGDSATLFETAPIATSSVVGDDVAIVATFDGNSLIFTGTLNGNVIDGRITTLITSGSLVLEIDNGPATMTKQ